ncbi:MAG: histidine kinase dimerization/phosphoacceptor domain -containing protein [Bacteroidia bacterium]
MKRLPSLVFMLICSISLHAQDSHIVDSLQGVLDQNVQDTNRVFTLVEMSVQYSQTDVEKSAQYAQEGLDLSRKLGFTIGEIKTSTALSRAYLSTGNLDSSIVLQKRCIPLTEELGMVRQKTILVNNLSRAFYKSGQIDSALRYNEWGLDLCWELNDTFWVSMALTNLAVIAHNKRDFKSMLEYNLKTYELRKAIGATSLEVPLNNIGRSYEELGRREEAKKAFQESLELALENENFHYTGLAYKNLGIMALNEDKPAEATGFYRKSLDVFESTKEKDMQAEVLIHLGEVEIFKQHFTKAEDYFAKSAALYGGMNQDKGLIRATTELAIAKIHNNKQAEAEKLIEETLDNADYIESLNLERVFLYDRVSTAYKVKGEFEMALLYREKQTILNDSLLQLSRDDEFAQMAEEYEADKREATIALLEENTELKDKQIANQYISMVGLALGILVLGGLAFLLFQNSNKRKAANVILAQQKDEIETQHAQKAMLLKEIHHRVKNNLQVISSLLNLQSREVDDLAAKEALNEGQNRVRSMALIHQRLYQKDELGLIDMQEYIEELVQNLQHSFAKAEKEITITTSLDSVEADVDKAIPIGLILNELITNAFKYAFEGKQQGNIALNMSLDAQKNFSLSVQDDGIGISDSDQKKGKSFGMKLVRSLSKGLNAKLDVQANDGTLVSILIPNFSAQVAV